MYAHLRSCTNIFAVVETFSSKRGWRKPTWWKVVWCLGSFHGTIGRSSVIRALSTTRWIARISARLNLIRAAAAITKSVHRTAELGYLETGTGSAFGGATNKFQPNMPRATAAWRDLHFSTALCKTLGSSREHEARIKKPSEKQQSASRKYRENRDRSESV